MSERQRKVVVVVAACTTGLVAWAAMALPPFPILGWYVAALPPSVDHWWYGLPDHWRITWLYDVGSVLSEAVYPVLIAVLFWIVSRPLRRGDTRTVRWTVVFIGMAAAASVVWFALGWRFGLEYQGLGTMMAYIVISATWLGVVLVGLRFVNRFESWWAHLALEFLAFTWVATFAFPWLGEMI